MSCVRNIADITHQNANLISSLSSSGSIIIINSSILPIDVIKNELSTASSLKVCLFELYNNKLYNLDDKVR